jgi:phage protein D
LGKRQADIDRLNEELAKAKESAKEEEEKRVKAINLLKTVRQKLVKVEKEKEEALKELSGAREKEVNQRGKEEAEKAKLQKEIETINAEREVAVAGLKAQFDKELLTMKERHEKETSAIRSQFELEAVTAKVRFPGTFLLVDRLTLLPECTY